MGSLKQDVEDRLPWLVDKLGFRVVNHTYSHGKSGSSVVQYQSDSLRLRFARNSRDGTSCEVASLAKPERWFELGFLWLALTGDRPDPMLEGWAWFVKDHLPKLVEALGPNLAQTKLQFAQREEESRQIVARYQPPFR